MVSNKLATGEKWAQTDSSLWFLVLKLPYSTTLIIIYEIVGVLI